MRYSVKSKESSPYPKVCVDRQNPYYANLLKDSFAGKESEFTLINQYLYHYYIIKEINKDIADALYEISKVEMKHMEILSSLIYHLAGDPVFRGGETDYEFWSGDNVYYGISVLDMLENNLKAEQLSIQNYRKKQKIIDDKNVKKVLERIILDEYIHIELLKKLINDFTKNHSYYY